MKDRNKTFLADSIDEGGSMHWYVKPNKSKYSQEVWADCNVKIRDCYEQVCYSPSISNEKSLLGVIDNLKFIVEYMKYFKDNLHSKKDLGYKNFVIWEEDSVGLIFNFNHKDLYGSPSISLQDSSKKITLDFGIDYPESPKFPLHLKSRKDKVQVLISEFERIILALEGNKGMFTKKFYY
jgi:hypothetical protein